MENKNIAIVIAEDEKDVRDMYTASFKSKGFKVFAAKNGIEAMEYLDAKKETISAILLDVVMPDMDGFEVLERIGKSENYKNVKIFINSNLENKTDHDVAKKLGADEYFVKVDWTPLQLAQQVKEMILKPEAKSKPSKKLTKNI